MTPHVSEVVVGGMALPGGGTFPFEKSLMILGVLSYKMAKKYILNPFCVIYVQDLKQIFFFLQISAYFCFV